MNEEATWRLKYKMQIFSKISPMILMKFRLSVEAAAHVKLYNFITSFLSWQVQHISQTYMKCDVKEVSRCYQVLSR